jgi:hypothetical protein
MEGAITTTGIYGNLHSPTSFVVFTNQYLSIHEKDINNCFCIHSAKYLNCKYHVRVYI